MCDSEGVSIEELQIDYQLTNIDVQHSDYTEFGEMNLFLSTDFNDMSIDINEPISDEYLIPIDTHHESKSNIT